ncbi:MAG: hypothetical protein QW514_04170 [Thermoprotei archaeon]
MEKDHEAQDRFAASVQAVAALDPISYLELTSSGRGLSRPLVAIQHNQKPDVTVWSVRPLAYAGA